jgi:recombination protein RecT
MTVPAKKQTIGNFINMPSTQTFLEQNLKEKRSEFVSNLIALSDSDKNIAECDPQKLMLCAMNATALNLPLNKNLGFAYIIAYGGVPSFQIGYKGLIQLAIRTGAYQTLNACEIREGEITRNKVTGEIKFIGEFPEKPIVGYMAHLKLNTGFTASLYMSEEQIEAHALRFSKSYQYDKQKKGNSSKWSDPLARPKMAMKTVLKGLLGTYGVLTTDMNNALANDNENEFESGNRSSIQEAEIVPQEDNGNKVKLTDLK